MIQNLVETQRRHERRIEEFRQEIAQLEDHYNTMIQDTRLEFGD